MQVANKADSHRLAKGKSLPELQVEWLPAANPAQIGFSSADCWSLSGRDRPDLSAAPT
jgi:hypothetical protein